VKALLAVHEHLVELGLRDEVTLPFGGASRPPSTYQRPSSAGPMGSLWTSPFNVWKLTPIWENSAS
jgi:hypothetical protein